MDNDIKVMIVEDLPPLLNKYKKALERDPEICVVAAVQNGYEATMMAAIHHPHVILMDIEMETKTAGLDAARQILAQFPEMKIVIFTVFEEDELVFQAFQLGVTDYVLKHSSNEEIIMGIKDAYHDRSPIRPVIAKKIRREFQRIRKNEASLLLYLHLVSTLTSTELDILSLLSGGKTRKEICEIRSVEMSTVKTQIHNITRKFEMNSIDELIHTLNNLKILETLQNVDKIKWNTNKF